MKRALKLATLAAALTLPLAVAQSALAAFTPAGTNIINSAELTYTVGTLPQPKTTAATNFNVDRKVNFNVTYVPVTFVDVLPGSTDQALKFTVTNQGNDVQDFDLTGVQLTGGNVFGSPDTIDATSFRLYKDDGNGSFDSGDTDITGTHYLDEVAADQTVTVYLVGDFLTPQVNANVAGVSLSAKAYYGHGAGSLGGNIPGGAATDTNGVVAGNTIYTVFADVADSQGNLELVYGAFRIAAPVLTVTKQSTVIWDPVNFNATPRSIPGAYVKYTITIANDAAALAPATLATIVDNLNANTALDANLVSGPLSTTATLVPTSGPGQSFMVTHVSGRALATPSYYAPGSEITVTGQSISADYSKLLPAEVAAGYAAGELRKGESVVLTFNVSIN